MAESVQHDNENTDGMESNALFQNYGRVLFNNIDRAKEILVEIGSTASADVELDRKMFVFGWALEAARFAGENGRKKGTEFVQSMEDALLKLVEESELTLEGSLALSDSWSTSGLVPPDSLSHANAGVAPEVETITDQDPDALKQFLDEILSHVDLKSSGSQTQLYKIFAKTLPSFPDSDKYEFVRMAVGMPNKQFADLGCTMLLTKNEAVRQGAMDGLFDRLKSGNLKSDNLSKLTVIRSWLEDEGTISRLDQLVRESIRKGLQQAGGEPDIEHLEIYSSAIDGAGTQSIMVSVRNGKSLAVAMLLLKHGRGVKDAFVIPCKSQTELNMVSHQIKNNISRVEFYEVPIDTVRQLVAANLHDGKQVGLAPAPGLVEWAQILGLQDIRPESGSVTDILALADPEDKVSRLEDGELEKLVAQSVHWPERFPIVNYWFESCDELDEILNSDDSQKRKWNRLIGFLEDKRGYWATCISRSALLLSTTGLENTDEFIAVAIALDRGWNLENIPVMEAILSNSIEIWENEASEISGNRMMSRKFENMFAGVGGDLENWDSQNLDDVRQELSRVLLTANHKLDRVDGYLIAICTSPVEIEFHFWIADIFNQLEVTFESDEEMKEGFKLMMLYARYVNLKLTDEGFDSIIPLDEEELEEWSKGYLGAMNEYDLCWPIELIGPIRNELITNLKNLSTNGMNSAEIRMEVSKSLEYCYKFIGQA